MNKKNKDIINQKISFNESKVNELLGVKTNSKKWKPEIGQRYWFVHYSEVDNYEWAGDGVDEELYEHKELFRTERAADFALSKKLFLRQMKEDFENSSDDIDWENRHQDKCYLGHYHSNGALEILSCNRLQTEGTLYTTNHNWLEQYIEENEQDIKAYVFNIKKKEEGSMFKVGDKVKFKDECQEGVGTVVFVDRPGICLVYSPSIIDGTDGGVVLEAKQHNEYNWWFLDEELSIISEEEALKKELEQTAAKLNELKQDHEQLKDEAAWLREEWKEMQGMYEGRTEMFLEAKEDAEAANLVLNLANQVMEYLSKQTASLAQDSKYKDGEISHFTSIIDEYYIQLREIRNTFENLEDELYGAYASWDGREGSPIEYYLTPLKKAIEK